jgi:hypothetical protein
MSMFSQMGTRSGRTTWMGRNSVLSPDGSSDRPAYLSGAGANHNHHHTHTHARTHARTHTRHARTHTRHTHTHTHTYTHRNTKKHAQDANANTTR